MVSSLFASNVKILKAESWGTHITKQKLLSHRDLNAIPDLTGCPHKTQVAEFTSGKPLRDYVLVAVLAAPTGCYRCLPSNYNYNSFKCFF